MAIETLDTDTAVKISRRNGATFLAVFGSRARGQENDASDVDLVVAFDSPKTLLDLVRIERELSESIGAKVDLVTEASISPLLRKRVEAEMEVLFDSRA